MPWIRRLSWLLYGFFKRFSRRQRMIFRFVSICLRILLCYWLLRWAALRIILWAQTGSLFYHDSEWYSAASTARRLHPEMFQTKSSNGIIQLEQRVVALKKTHACPCNNTFDTTNMPNFPPLLDTSFSNQVFVIVSKNDPDYLSWLWNAILLVEYTAPEKQLFMPEYTKWQGAMPWQACDQSSTQPLYCDRKTRGVTFKLISDNAFNEMHGNIRRILLIGDNFIDDVVERLSVFTSSLHPSVLFGMLSLAADNCNNFRRRGHPLANFVALIGRPIVFVGIPFGDCMLEAAKPDYMRYSQFPLGPSSLHGFPMNVSNGPTWSERHALLNLRVTYTQTKSTRMAAYLAAENLCSESSQNQCYLTNTDLWSKIAEGLDRAFGWHIEQHLALDAPAEREYLNILKDSRFTLCPAGNNPEQYRIWEAIAAGSIPVIEDSDMSLMPLHPTSTYFYRCRQLDVHRVLHALDAPVIFVRDWKNLKQALSKYTSTDLEEMQSRLPTFYYRLKLYLLDEILQGMRLMA